MGKVDCTHKHHLFIGFIKGEVVYVLYLYINDVIHNPPLPAIGLYPQSAFIPQSGSDVTKMWVLVMILTIFATHLRRCPFHFDDSRRKFFSGVVEDELLVNPHTWVRSYKHNLNFLNQSLRFAPALHKFILEIILLGSGSCTNT